MSGEKAVLWLGAGLMRVLVAAGRGRPLPGLAEYVHYAGHWWITAADQTRWLRITGPAIAAELDAAAQHLATTPATPRRGDDR